MKSVKLPVSERAIVQRLNRALGQKQQALRRTRRHHAAGEFYILDLDHNAVVAQDVNLLDLAKRLAVLKPYEEFQWEGSNHG